MTLAEIAADLFDPDRFVFGRGFAPACSATRLTLPWDVIHGRLLPPAQSRRSRTFDAWCVHDDDLILAILADGDEVHVVRGVQTWVHEPVNGDEGLTTREASRRVLERIESWPASEVVTSRDEIARALHRAVVGSRLPLAPPETAHPLYSFGMIHYRDPQRAHRDFEFDLRRDTSMGEIVTEWGGRAVKLLKRAFLESSLSPETGFLARSADFLRECERAGHVTAAEATDFVAWLLRLSCRHLTAYDLHRFHHAGANYPDALLIDQYLGDLLRRADADPARFIAPDAVGLRSSLAVALLTRRAYEGHPVPDVPTTPGEHARDYPLGYPRVPEAQLTDFGARTKRLFADSPLTLSATHRDILRAALADLASPEVWEEYGSALYLDRPFARAESAAVIDDTPLIASIAFSPSVAVRRHDRLRRELGLGPADPPRHAIDGVRVSYLAPPVRQGTVSLTDAAQVATDFVFRRTTASGLRLLASMCLDVSGVTFVGRNAAGVMLFGDGFDILAAARIQGWTRRDGVAVPVAARE